MVKVAKNPGIPEKIPEKPEKYPGIFRFSGIFDLRQPCPHFVQVASLRGGPYLVKVAATPKPKVHPMAVKILRLESGGITPTQQNSELGQIRLILVIRILGYTAH